MGRRDWLFGNAWRVLYLCAFLFFVLIISSANAQGVYEAWVARYNGPGNSGDGAKALAVDDSNNIYVTGLSFGDGTFYDYATIKYSSKGDTLWVRRYNGTANSFDEASALAIDTAGNVYVTGSSHGNATGLDYATIKYAPNGDSLWVRRYNGPANLDDEPYAIAVNDSGYVHVTGRSQVSSNDYDYATVKYSANGETIWVRRYNGPTNGFDRAYDLKLDIDGNVYVTGGSEESDAQDDIVTIKYAPDGDTTWVKRYDGTGNDDDWGNELAIDESGYLYVCGVSIGSTSSGKDYVVIKYTPAGDTAWVRRYDYSDDIAYSLALGSDGSAYVTGLSNIEFATLKFTAIGDIAWIRRYHGQSGASLGYRLALDKSNNVYVTGWSQDTLYNYDYATIKYSSEGDSQWCKRYDGPGRNTDMPQAIVVDNSGNVYVTGVSMGSGTSEDFATIKYSPCSAIPGDVNGVGGITLTDIIHLINFYFDKDKPPCIGTDPGNCWEPNPVCRADVDGTAGTAITDIIYLVNYYFDKDRPATSCVGSSPGNCWTPVANGACCMPVP